MLPDELTHQGNFLFRWRSYLPVLLLALVVPSLRDADRFELWVGDAIDDAFELACLSVTLLGVVMRVLTVGFVPASTSGRNTKRQKAATLNTTGMYSIVRHPLYVANFLIFAGLIAHMGVWYLTLMSVLAYCLYYERIMYAEEAFLRSRFGDAFTRWAVRTPGFLPRFSHACRPAQPFSWRMAVRREHSTVLCVAALLYLLDIAGDLMTEGVLEHEPVKLSLMIAAILGSLCIHLLKRHTTALRAP
jgi:protein-S-isoprenylcysteine O-methyltransferase Ste14